ncbi:FAD-NAD(P)-binding [Spirosomataceae bacterium TFI 002]|nr:FAD-NAD(P)-binding [Spirosomataceae bacterium TFI 002]
MIKIGIVGCGPRGLASLEALISKLSSGQISQEFFITIFEPAPFPGAGKVWSPEQSTANWANISLRSLSQLPGREPLKLNDLTIPGFPKFTQWVFQKHGIVNNSKQDLFVKRSMIGEYLNERFKSIFKVLKKEGLACWKRCKVEELKEEKGKIALQIKKGKSVTVDECLLTLGHLKTKPDKQISTWMKHADNKQIQLFTSPYLKKLAKKIKRKDIVGIRGFGLGTIDVVRLLTVEKGSKFKKRKDSFFLEYVPSSKSIETIVPFSLDGLPPSPKPLNELLDLQYEPSELSLIAFQSKVKENLDKGPEAKSTFFLKEAFANIAVDTFASKYDISTRELKKLAKQWLVEPTLSHELILDHELDTVEYMKSLVLMASGEKKATLDYCFGQLWRHLQPDMYRLFSHCSLDDKLMTEIIELDEATKRYSFGPPVESILQLIALAEAKVLNLEYVNNPTIDTQDKGWQFNNAMTCSVMIDSVLSPPKLAETDSKLIKKLMDNDELKLVTSDLGISTSSDGRVESSNEKLSQHLTMLGRNCKGSVMGVDAILECFGPRIDDWAIGFCDRL